MAAASVRIAGSICETAASTPRLRSSTVIIQRFGISAGWEDCMQSGLGTFMGGPFMEYARVTRAAAGRR